MLIDDLLEDDNKFSIYDLQRDPTTPYDGFLQILERATVFEWGDVAAAYRSHVAAKGFDFRRDIRGADLIEKIRDNLVSDASMFRAVIRELDWK